MAVTRKRARQQRGDTTTESGTYPTNTSTATTGTMTDSTSYDTSLPPSDAYGPSNWVDPVTYRQLRAKFRKGYTKKRATKSKKRTYSRRYNRGYTHSSGLSGMGPIVITGRGGYWGDKLRQGASAAWKSLGRATPAGTFARLGQAAGGAMFGAPGASVGNWLGTGVSNVLGFGDYAIKRNDLMQLNEGIPVPTFTDLNQGVIICHREYIQDITQTTAFALNKFSINPGLPATFPWLSTIAPCFDQYEILGCLFQYRSTASDFGTTTNMAMGTVIMSTEYDTVDQDYASKIEMENAQYTMSGKPSADMIHPIECDPTLVGPSGLKYVRTGNVPSGADVRLYDHGKFFLATTGMPADGGQIGELWVTYKIAFYKPQLSGGLGVQTDYLNHAGSVDGFHPLGNPTVPLSSSSIGGTITGTTYTFPPNIMVNQKFLVLYRCLGSSTTLTNPMNPTITGAAATSTQKLDAGAVNSAQIWGATLLITAPSASIDFSTGTPALPSSAFSIQLIVTQLDRDQTY